MVDTAEEKSRSASGSSAPESDPALVSRIMHANGRDIVAYIQTRLSYPQCDIASMRGHRLNTAYPVLSLVFSQIEYISSILYSDSSNGATSRTGRFIHEELGRINPNYSFTYKTRYKLPNKTGKAGNFGELLYQTLRSKVAHQSGCYPPFEVTAEEQLWHLHLRFDAARRLFMVHAYRMNEELQGALQMLYSRIEAGEFLDELRSGILRDQESLQAYQNAVAPMLEHMETIQAHDLDLDSDLGEA